MTRYFFDLHECGHSAVIDEEGAELASPEAARAHAIVVAREIMAGEVCGGHLCLGCAIAIRDDNGTTVMAVPFADALSVTFAKDC